ncbi:transglutaminase domain-containing protein [Nonomuraea turkmeniaca]|uniref:Transglutaminase domain-containing protein n=1 Tax=Nonomuraea turkmeniaca TaxID=103838 RepID=A0A5S4EYX0_9ACTN|nr:transglutaminase domain-containing protein [Nonomuraea turkmeniaca]TMR08953.1 transglutaminase domain-containing protein [Nonomuraea turkmeniaca]
MNTSVMNGNEPGPPQNAPARGRAQGTTQSAVATGQGQGVTQSVVAPGRGQGAARGASAAGRTPGVGQDSPVSGHGGGGRADRGRRRMGAFMAGGCALAAVIGMLPVVAFAGAFGRTPAEALADPRYLLPTAGAALVVAAACLVTAVATRLPPVTRLTIGVLALAVHLMLVAPSDLFSGPFRLLTSIPPLDLDGAELATVALLAGLATLAAAEPVLRGRSVAWALPVALLGTAAGLAVSAASGSAAWLGPAAALVMAALLVLGAWPRGGGVRLLALTGRRSHLIVAAAVPVVVAAGVAASLVLPGVLAPQARPVDARELVPQPVRPRQVTSPLAEFPALHRGRTKVRLTVTADRPVTRLRYATLTVFDGTYWTAAGTYWRAGTRLPDPGDNAPRATVTERVRVEEPGTLGMLVSSGRPVEVSAPGLGVNPDTGDVVLPDDRPAPPEYTVRSVVPSTDPARLAVDQPAPGPARDPTVATFAVDAKKIAGTERGHDALRRLADHFARGGYAEDSSPTPPSGHGNWQIRRLMEKTKNGTAEQYASAFAVLARSLGYDVRVVVGFLPPKRQGDRYRITERDVDAWAEVRFAQAGWVPFHPTPRKESPDEAEAVPEEDPAPPADSDPRQPDPATPASTPPEPATTTAPPWQWSLLAVAALLVAMAAVPILKGAVRARRRRTADPRGRVAAAWRETLDRYADAGLRTVATTTAGEAATAAATRFPAAAPATGELLELVNLAMYGAHEISPAEGERAWALADTARARLRSALPFGSKVVAALRPRWGTFPISRRAARS